MSGTLKIRVLIVMAVLFVRRVTVRVRAVRLAMEQASIAANAKALANIQHAMELEAAHIAATANAQNARVVEIIVAVIALAMVYAREDAEVLEHIWVVLVLRVKVLGNAPNAMDRVPLENAPNVLELGNAIHVMAVDNARHVMVRVNVPIVVEIPDAIPVVATAIVINARIVMASVLTVVARAMYG